jgi:hypothetical protein
VHFKSDVNLQAGFDPNCDKDYERQKGERIITKGGN